MNDIAKHLPEDSAEIAEIALRQAHDAATRELCEAESLLSIAASLRQIAELMQEKPATTVTMHELRGVMGLNPIGGTSPQALADELYERSAD